MKHFILLGLIFISLVSFSQKSQKTTIDPILKGSGKSQRAQNREADKEDLSRIKNDAQLESFKKAGLLVSIEGIPGIYIDPKLPEKLHCSRPDTKLFLERIGFEFQAKFGKELKLTSATRTIEYQEALEKTNKNAAKAHGSKASSHLTGASIDFTKLTLTAEQANWMRSVLKSLEKKGLIEATEERQQKCFHIMVFKSYVGYAKEHPLKKVA